MVEDRRSLYGILFCLFLYFDLWSQETCLESIGRYVKQDKTKTTQLPNGKTCNSIDLPIPLPCGYNVSANPHHPPPVMPPVSRLGTTAVLALGTSSTLPYGTDSDGLGAILFGNIFNMTKVNRATRGCSTVKCCLPGEVSFQNTIQKHDTNSCTNSLLDRIGRCTTTPITFYRYSCAKWRLLHPSLLAWGRKQPKFAEVGENVPNAVLGLHILGSWQFPILMHDKVFRYGGLPWRYLTPTHQPGPLSEPTNA